MKRKWIWKKNEGGGEKEKRGRRQGKRKEGGGRGGKNFALFSTISFIFHSISHSFG